VAPPLRLERPHPPLGEAFLAPAPVAPAYLDQAPLPLERQVRSFSESLMRTSLKEKTVNLELTLESLLPEQSFIWLISHIESFAGVKSGNIQRLCDHEDGV
jgi:hypothetical protein